MDPTEPLVDENKNELENGNENEEENLEDIQEPTNEQPSDQIKPNMGEVVENLTVQALREYDDGPLTPEQDQNQDRPQMNNDDEDEDNENNDPNDDESVDNNLVVLDPDHPLMQRFQKRLKDQLSNREQKITLELREAKYQSEKAKHEREEAGVELYGLQQELAKHQMLLEKEHDKYNETNQSRNLVEKDLVETRNDYRKYQTNVNDELKKVRDLQQERDNLKLRIFYMNNAKDDIRGDIAVIRRATEKADVDKNKFEIDKQHQDVIVNRIEEKVIKLNEDIALYESQYHNQLKETKHARDALIEARMETEAIEKEKNQLMQNWASCLIGMKRRDEAHSQMNDAIRAQQQKFDSTMSEINSYKKSIIKEQEKNENLTIMINHRKGETKNLEKSLKTNRDKMDLLQQEYSAYNRALKETESTLGSINLEKNQKSSLINQYQRDIETISQEKLKLEDEIFQKLQTKLTADKAAKYSDKLRTEQREKLRELERSLAKLDNEIAKARLEGVQTQTVNEALERDIKMLNTELEDKNRIISKSESEIRQRVLIIEHKQGQIDVLNKKIENLIEKAGGVELGPLELEEKKLTKEIEDYLAQIMELEQKWLREQNELVRLVKEHQKMDVDLKHQQKNFVILTTKKMRIEKTIESEQANIKQLTKNLDNLRLQSEKLNKFIFKEIDTKTQLEKNNELTENDFIETLKRAEVETNKMQDRLEQIKKEKEQLLEDLISTDEQIMVWEKRIQIAKEMKAAVDSENGQGEIKEMKFEIHRMKVRYTELMKQQEKLVREMESSVSRRDTIITRGDHTNKDPKVVTKGKLQREIVETQKRIKDTSQETGKLEIEIRLSKDKQQQLARILEDKQKNIENLQEQAEIKNAEVEELSKRKQESMDELLKKQRNLKYYDQVKHGKYTMLCKEEEQNDQETVKQLDRLRSLTTIVGKISEEFPNLQTIIRKVETSLQSRLNSEEISTHEKS